MGLTSEQVHWIGGAAFAFVAVALLGHLIAPERLPWAPALLPALLIGYGLESFLDPFIHGGAAPANYGAETTQHLVQGTAAFAAGVIEWARLRGALTGAGWGMATPVALLVIAIVFLVHAQHDATVSPMVLMVQHRALAITLAVAAAARAATLLAPGVTALQGAWLLPLFVFGLLMLAYTERDRGMGGHAAPTVIGADTLHAERR